MSIANLVNLKSIPDGEGIGCPTGFIFAYAGNTNPKGWLLCDGSAKRAIDYPALYSVIGTTYGAGGGAGEFSLPDLTGEYKTIQGSTTSINAKVSGGTANVTLTAGEIPTIQQIEVNSVNAVATTNNGYFDGDSFVDVTILSYEGVPIPQGTFIQTKNSAGETNTDDTQTAHVNITSLAGLAGTIGNDAPTPLTLTGGTPNSILMKYIIKT
jgi:microcystin-dependent protein